MRAFVSAHEGKVDNHSCVILFVFRSRQAGNSLHHRQKGGHQDGEPRETQRVGAHEGESWYFCVFDTCTVHNTNIGEQIDYTDYR